MSSVDLDGLLGDALVLSAVVLLLIQSLAFLGGALLLRHQPRDDPNAPGWPLLRILVTVSGVFVLVQALSLWRAVLIVAAPDDLTQRICNFLFIELLSTATIVWSMWRTSSLLSPHSVPPVDIGVTKSGTGSAVPPSDVVEPPADLGDSVRPPITPGPRHL